MNIFFQLALSLLVCLIGYFGMCDHPMAGNNTPNRRAVRVLFWSLLTLGALTWIWQ